MKCGIVSSTVGSSRSAPSWFPVAVARAGHGVATCKKRYIMAEPDKFFGQVGYDPLRAAVQTRGYALNERSDLRDFHNDLCSRPKTNACNAAKFLRAMTTPITTKLRWRKRSSGCSGLGGARRQPELV